MRAGDLHNWVARMIVIFAGSTELSDVASHQLTHDLRCWPILTGGFSHKLGTQLRFQFYRENSLFRHDASHFVKINTAIVYTLLVSFARRFIARQGFICQCECGGSFVYMNRAARMPRAGSVEEKTWRWNSITKSLVSSLIK